MGNGRGLVLLCLVAGCGDAHVTKAVPCHTAADCPSGQLCNAGQCGPCKKDGDCTAPATCGGGGVVGLCDCPDADGDGHRCDDCNDRDATQHPGAVEICDYKDNDCDGAVDEGLTTTWYVDNDHDLYGDPAGPVTTCFPPAGFVADGTDCNDADPTIHPGHPEICDYKDNNCDGTVDEGVRTTYYRDADGDGYGDKRNAISACTEPGGYVADDTECDDTRADVHPGAAEVCNNRDDDCDGVVDGNTRPCDNACGAGSETCTAGAFGGCTAPLITVVNVATRLSGGASYVCLDVQSALTVDADVIVAAANWIHVESAGQVTLGARARLQAIGDLSFLGGAQLGGSEATLSAGGTVSLDGPTRWTFANYSGGGAAACTDGTAKGVGGGAGGARGGGGGRGGHCGALETQPTIGAGGALAQDGSAGCDCDCATSAAGGTPAGGAGGAAWAGGGGGGNGGKGGDGTGGVIGAGSFVGGTGGQPEASPGPEPTVGGGGGGAGGTAYTTSGAETCKLAGGSGGGLVHVLAANFVNKGVVFANGANAPNFGSGVTGGFSSGGGGGGGAGGTLVFHVGRFENLGSLSTVGGAGASGDLGAASGVSCANGRTGGGGGGGGGRVFVAGPLAGGALNVVLEGNVFVGGGKGGAATCGQPTGQDGVDGWIQFP